MPSWRDSKLRRFILAALSRYCRLVKIPASFAAIRNSPNQNIVVSQGDSLVFRALLDSFAKRSGLKGVWHCSALFESPTPSMDPNYIYWLSVEEENLLESLGSLKPALNFVTLNIFRARGPVRNPPRYRMSIWRQLGLLFGARLLIIIFGEPQAIDTEIPRSGKQIARLLKVDFYRNLKLLRGTPFQSIETQANTILAGAEFEREVKIIATRMGRSETAVKQLARNEFFGIAANPRVFIYWIASPICNFLIKRLFTEIKSYGLENLVSAVRDNTVVLVPMHRSHLDYIVLGSTLYNSNLNTPVVAAGLNLNFWPFGMIIRSLGGYFVKRNARHDRIHALVLKRYVTYLVKRGHLQEFFIEGGRSRSGKMAQPKVGLLSTIINGYLKGIRKDILFVPVSITYENVIEDEVFGDENTGQSKTKETLLALFRAREFFKKTYGEVMINYGEPISVSKAIGDTPRRRANAEPDVRHVVQNIAGRLTRSIRDACDLTLVSLAHTALMCAPDYGLTRKALSARVHALSELANMIGPLIGGRPDFTTSLEHFLRGRELILNDLTRSGVVQIKPCLDSDVFFVPGGKRYTADFYKNSSIHLFILPGLFAICELSQGKFKASDLEFWHDIFGFDFQLQAKPDFLAQAEALCQVLLKKEILIKTDADCLVFRDRNSASFIPALLQNSIQALLWVYHNLELSVDPGDPKLENLGSCSFQELMDKLQDGFKTAHYLGRVTRTEAASQSAIISALESLKNRQIISYDELASASSRRVTFLRKDNEVMALLAKADGAIRKWQTECSLIS